MSAKELLDKLRIFIKECGDGPVLIGGVENFHAAYSVTHVEDCDENGVFLGRQVFVIHPDVPLVEYVETPRLVQ